MPGNDFWEIVGWALACSVPVVVAGAIIIALARSWSLAVSMVALMLIPVLATFTGVLGVGWDGRTRRHSHVPQWEIVGVSDGLRTEFSQRATAIEAGDKQLVLHQDRIGDVDVPPRQPWIAPQFLTAAHFHAQQGFAGKDGGASFATGGERNRSGVTRRVGIRGPSNVTGDFVQRRAGAADIQDEQLSLD